MNAHHLHDDTTDAALSSGARPDDTIARLIDQLGPEEMKAWRRIGKRLLAGQLQYHVFNAPTETRDMRVEKALEASDLIVYDEFDVLIRAASSARFGRRVIVESPFAGDVERNRRYARAALRDSLLRGEAPFASHLLYTQALDDEVADERRRGMEAGFSWLAVADATVVYSDLGISRGMREGILRAVDEKRPIEVRRLGGGWGSP